MSCGAPAELDEGRFPADYADETASAGAGVLPPLAGSGGTSGTGNAGTAGNTGAPSGGTGGAAPVGGGGAPLGGGGGSGTGTGQTGGTGGVVPSGNCPDDILTLFNRPSDQGGCAGAICHIPGQTAPDLVSPNPEQRLFNQPSVGECNPRPLIGADDSVLADKISDSPECGAPMPFLAAAALNDADRACILAWIDEVSGG